jgi:hypothetical protein
MEQYGQSLIYQSLARLENKFSRLNIEIAKIMNPKLIKRICSILKIVSSKSIINFLNGVVKFNKNELVNQIKILKFNCFGVIFELFKSSTHEFETLPNFIAKIPITYNSFKI